MSRNAEKGIEVYFKMLEQGINLVFLKEPHINTEVYKRALEGNKLEATDNQVVNAVLKGVREALDILARQQIEIAFEQSEKEVEDLRQRTKEGLREAKASGKTLGRVKGSTVKTKRASEITEKLKKHSRAFGGSMTDKEFIEAFNCSKTTLIKFKKQIKTKLE